ncbi:hypothetical protein ACHAWF_001793 [Thalassiosira exigua]
MMLPISGRIFAFVGLATATVVSSSASRTPRIRRGDDGSGTGDPDQKLLGSLWPFGKSDVESGITFERTETPCPLLQVEEQLNMLPVWQRLTTGLMMPPSEHLLRSSSKHRPRSQFMQSNPPHQPRANFDSGHCKSSDEFGGNICHYSWGDDITVDYDGKLDGQALGQDIYLEMSLQVDGLVHHHQTCTTVYSVFLPCPT